MHALRTLCHLALLSVASSWEPPLDPLGVATAEAAATNGRRGARRQLGDFVEVKVPTSLEETLDLALIHVPLSPDKATDPPAEYLLFDMSVTPGNKFIALTKDGASAPPTKVTVRLSFVEDEPPLLWRLVSVGCANATDLCARPTSSTDLADPNRLWNITRPEARLNATSDLVVSFNASGLPENLAEDAYTTELDVEVVEASGTARRVTLAVSTSVATEVVASRSGWGVVPAGRPCAEANLGKFAAAQAPAVVGEVQRVPVSLCDFEGLAVARRLPRVDDARLVTLELVQTEADDGSGTRPAKVIASARGVYQGGALYEAELSLPHLGNFSVTAQLGGEAIGKPLQLIGECPTGLLPMIDGVHCGEP